MISPAQQKQLDAAGYVVIPDVLSAAEIESYRTQLLALAEAEREGGSGRVHTDGRGQHVRWLVNKGRDFEALVVHPKVVPYFEYLLGEDSSRTRNRLPWISRGRSPISSSSRVPPSAASSTPWWSPTAEMRICRQSSRPLIPGSIQSVTIRGQGVRW
jgi:hypothetical protein